MKSDAFKTDAFRQDVDQIWETILGQLRKHPNPALAELPLSFDSTHYFARLYGAGHGGCSDQDRCGTPSHVCSIEPNTILFTMKLETENVRDFKLNWDRWEHQDIPSLNILSYEELYYVGDKNSRLKVTNFWHDSDGCPCSEDWWFDTVTFRFTLMQKVENSDLNPVKEGQREGAARGHSPDHAEKPKVFEKTLTRHYVSRHRASCAEGQAALRKDSRY